ncbi:MAG: GNAT family N-acetyltransferase [Armatimonadetes bacterium]|nr:GNAT family N-acetyltransferase [Armatimonadota bacterium]
MLELVPVHKDNWRAVRELELKAGQQTFLHTNLYSLAEAFVKPDAPEYLPLVICEDGEVVGFAMIARDPEADLHWISRFMIDAQHQGRGLGRAGMLLVLDFMKQCPSCANVHLSVSADNAVALALYASLGFVPTGEKEGEGQDIYRVHVR